MFFSPEEQEKIKQYWSWYDECLTCGAKAEMPCMSLHATKSKRRKPNRYTTYNRGIHKGRHRFTKAEKEAFKAASLEKAREETKGTIERAKRALETVFITDDWNEYY